MRGAVLSFPPINFLAWSRLKLKENFTLSVLSKQQRLRHKNKQVSEVLYDYKTARLLFDMKSMSENVYTTVIHACPRSLRGKAYVVVKAGHGRYLIQTFKFITHQPFTHFALIA
jgi:hypothetical protein